MAVLGVVGDGHGIIGAGHECLRLGFGRIQSLVVFLKGCFWQEMKAALLDGGRHFDDHFADDGEVVTDRHGAGGGGRCGRS